jgi:uncharacterized protein (TIGR02996 family)
VVVEDELLAAVVRAPDDDGPRLIYADWLEERGDPARAELIRVQCALAAGPPDDQRPRLERRERELLRHHGRQWAEPLGDEVQEWVFERGFIERVGMWLERPTREILQVLERAPTLRHLRDHSQMCDLSGLVGALPRLSHLTGLELWWLYAVDDELVRELLQPPHLAGLKTLILHHDRNGDLVDDEVLVEGLHAPHRTNLEALAVNVDCSWRGPSNDVIAAIASSAHLRRLRRLDLSNAGDPGNRPQLTLEVVQTLLASPNLAQLEELDLRAVYAPPEVWDALAEGLPPRLARLWIAGAGHGRGLEGWRARFARVPQVDWDTRYRDPLNGGVWVGQSRSRADAAPDPAGT